MKFLISTFLFVTMTTLAIAQEDSMIPKPFQNLNGGTMLGLGGDYAYVATGSYSTQTPPRMEHPLISAEADDYISGNLEATAKVEKTGSKISSTIDINHFSHYVFNTRLDATVLGVQAECKNKTAVLKNLGNIKGTLDYGPSVHTITGENNQVIEADLGHVKYVIIANEVTETTIGNKKRIVKNAFKFNTVETQYPSEYIFGHVMAEAECE